MQTAAAQQLDEVGPASVSGEFVRDPEPIASVHDSIQPGEWPRPINLFRNIAAPPLCAEDAPPAIGRYAEQFARAGGFDPTGPIVAGVVACAAVIDDGIRLRLPGSSEHYQSARLWGADIGPPGAGKSPAQRAMLHPIFDLHRELVEKGSEAAAPDDGEERSPTLALFTSDSTIDALSDLLADNPRGLLYCVDEFDSWLGQHEAFGREGGARNRGEWMRLYDGGPHQVHRVRRGSYFVKNWGASVLTATTPAALSRHARKLTADGLFQRFMVFVVDRMVERDHSVPHVAVQSARRSYEARIRAIYGHSADLVDKAIVALSSDASVLYEAEERRLRLLTESAEAIGEGFAAHVAKHIGMLARVALTFHAASDDLACGDGTSRHPCAANVSGPTMRLAVRFMRRAYQHAFAIYTSCLGNGSPMDLAKATARAILADGLESFNRRDMTQKCGAFRPKNASELQRIDALRTLEDFGWITGDTISPEHGGRWTVNPQVHVMFAEERERAIERRAAVQSALAIE